MSQHPESKQLARAVRRHVNGMIGHHAQKIVKGQVLDTQPLVVGLMGSDVEIEADHLLLGTWVRYFDGRFGISVDDTVLLTRLDDDDWFVVDVISNSNFEIGDHPEDRTNVAFNTGSGNIVAKIPYHASDGTLLGVMLLYNGATLRNFAGHTTAAGSGAPVVPD